MSKYVNSDTIPGHSLSGSGKMVPDALPDNAYDRAKTPTVFTYTKSPNYIYVIADTVGKIGAFFGSSASFAKTATANGQGANAGIYSASVGYDDLGLLKAGTSINLSPSAWSGSASDGLKIIISGVLDQPEFLEEKYD